MAGSRHFLVSFESVTATVGGRDVSSIIELQLQASANDIPSVTLLVDAGHPGRSDEASVASGMSLVAAKELYTGLVGGIRTSTLDLSVTVRAAGSTGGDVQTLRLSGWILTDVSLSPIQIGGVASVAITCQHPICRSHFGGAVPGLLVREPALDDLTGDDPLSVFISSLGMYATAARDTDVLQVESGVSADTTETREKLLKHLERAKSALESTVTWSGGGLPLPSSNLPTELIRYGLSCYAVPSGGTSVFQRLVGGLVPECSLSLGGDYMQDRLSLRPFTPWEKASLSIWDSDIVTLQFPQSDPSPLSGVCAVSLATETKLPASYQVYDAQVSHRPSEAYYVPRAELDADMFYGEVHQLQEPGWLASLRSAVENTASTGDSDFAAAGSGNMQTPTNTDIDNPAASFQPAASSAPDTGYASALVTCAKAYYETSLMKDWAFGFGCRFILTGGGVLCPGKVVSVMSDGGVVLEGYVVSVTHTLSVVSRTARTSVACTHPRIGGVLPRGIADSDTQKNALYT